jgi:predicted ATP-grasp superfamily ATP-dependent carboligase
MWSRWVQSQVTVPGHHEPDAFVSAVLRAACESGASVVLPAMDESIACLRPWRDVIEEHTALALANEPALAIATNKARTLETAAAAGLAVPVSVPICDEASLAAALDAIGFPAVVKPAVPWSRDNDAARAISKDVLSEAEALLLASEFWTSGVPCMLQEWVGGRREAVALFRAGRQVLAEFAYASERTWPVLGGCCVVRESIALPPDLRAAARDLADAIDLDGYCLAEFRRDRLGRPVLMEVNPRLTGSVELAVRSGVDFPLMTWLWAIGSPIARVSSYRIGTRMRWFAGDLRWLAETMRRQGRPDSVTRRKAVGMFLGDFCRPSAYDCVDLSDPGPVLAEVGLVMKGIWRGARSTGARRA